MNIFIDYMPISYLLMKKNTQWLIYWNTLRKRALSRNQ